MKRTYIKPVATVTRVETQTSYCNAISYAVYGRKFHDYGEVEVESLRTKISPSTITILGNPRTGSPRGLRPLATTTYYN